MLQAAGSRHFLAARHLLASRPQPRLHACRRMACEKKNVKGEISKECEKMVKKGGTRQTNTLTPLDTTLTPCQLRMPLSSQTTTLTPSQLRFNVAAYIFACCARAHILTMPRTFSFSQYSADEDDGASCMWAHAASTYSRVYVGRRPHCMSMLYVRIAHHTIHVRPSWNLNTLFVHLHTR